MNRFGQLESSACNLGDLLGTKTFIIPFYQRYYSWHDREIENFLRDIYQLVDKEYEIKFLGSVVLREPDFSLSTEERRYEVIDGQQRITTCYLLLLALASAAVDSGHEEFAIALAEDYLLSQKRRLNIKR